MSYNLVFALFLVIYVQSKLTHVYRTLNMYIHCQQFSLHVKSEYIIHMFKRINLNVQNDSVRTCS